MLDLATVQQDLLLDLLLALVVCLAAATTGLPNSRSAVCTRSAVLSSDIYVGTPCYIYIHVLVVGTLR